MNDENELLEPLATEAGQEAIVRAIRDISSLEYAVRAEQAASLASAKAGEASQSAIEASEAENKAKDWATKTDTYVEQETITIPPAQEGEEPTTETINLYSARYYAALALDIYNNMSFDSVPTENSNNMVSSGTVYSALDLKADKSNTYTKTEVDTALSNVQSTLTFDNVPTANSDNPVKSSGIKTALDSKQDTLTFDSTPTSNSNNPVTSGGIYTALQNVEIEIDDEITEDSDNPVTSAAIYEALLNFTPSGGGGLATFPSINTNNLIYTIYDNMSSWAYDVDVTYIATENCFIVGGINVNFNSTPSKNTGVGIFVNDVLIQLINHSTTEHSSGAGVLVPLSKGDKIRMKTLSGSIKAYLYVYGVKNNELLLSEQMYSNVLYENSSGVTSGTITLNDNWDNYDFIGVHYGIDTTSEEIFDKSTLINNKNNNKYTSVMGGNGNTRWTLTDYNKFVINGTGNVAIKRVVGIKLAKGGYSGIVSDARMTVKSGTYTYNLSISSDISIPITFDSPMPDTNYLVFVNPAGGGAYSTFAIVSTGSHTINGFNIYVRRKTSDTIQNSLIIDWIAIRPNSYTREGMVEDVLFSNASGINSGTINLSGNISDYDLIEIYRFANDNKELYSSVVSSSDLLQRNSDLLRYVAIGDGNNYTEIYCPTDSSIVIRSISGEKITKITGIKFGRYVSGVAVDTTVTQNSNAVVTSGAVYNALLNIPSGGGGSGGSITVDNSITSSSLNPVSSSAIYNVVSPLMPSSLDDISNAQVKLNTSNLAVCVIGGRTYYKRYSDIAAGFVTQVKGNYGRVWIYLILVSPTENGAILYCSYSPSDNAGVSTFVHNGKTYYYSVSIYGWYDKTFSDVSMSLVLVYEDTFDTALIAASFLIEYATLKNNFLSTFNITDAYTKTEVDTLLQNAGGSSVTVDSSITQNSTNPVESAAIYTALANKGDVTTDTAQNITGTKTFVGSKKIAFKLSAANDKLGFTLFGNTGTERGYLEFNPTNTIDGVAGLMTLGNYATSAGALTHVGFRRYSNISGASGAYNLLMPMVADARTPFSLTTTYLNFYLPLGFTDGTTTVRTAKSGLVDLSPLLASLEARIAALEGN